MSSRRSKRNVAVAESSRVRKRIYVDSTDTDSEFEETSSNKVRKPTHQNVKSKDQHEELSVNSESYESDITDTTSTDGEKDDSDKPSKISTRASNSKKVVPKSKVKTKGRKKIKKIIEDEDLQEQTKEAEKEERERLKRLKEKNREQESTSSHEKPLDRVKLVLQKQPEVEVSSYIACKLRPHQIEGIHFIWNNMIESTDRAESSFGAGCILAHCMGLGKTLQTIAIVHTALKCRHLPFSTVLVVAPLNTVRNWIGEFVCWCEDGDELNLYNFAETKSIKERVTMLKSWKENGGVLISGYDMYRIMTMKVSYKQWRKVVEQTLVNPGPDIVVCDEGHMLKNADTHISKQLNKIRSKRRLVLTGTPLQNNLVEYHCMVNFVKPDLLGSLKEFRNRFVNPITNGQHIDSTDHDVKVMKKRSHVLHQILEGFVQRKDYTCLKPYLSSKFEYVIKVRLTPLQIKLYQHYLDTMTNRGTDNTVVNSHGKGSSLFADYQNLMRVWTHPKSLLIHTEQQEKILKRREENDFITDAEESGSSSDEWKDSDDDDKREQSVEEVAGPVVITDTSDTDEEELQKRRLKKLKLKKKPVVTVSSDEEYSAKTSKSSAASSESSDSEEEEKLPHRRNRTRSSKHKRRYKLRGAFGDSDSTNEDSVEEQLKEERKEQWYDKILQEDSGSTEDYQNSLKLVLLFEILRMAEERKEKVLVFSQSLISLDLIEEMLPFAPSPSNAVIDSEETEQLSLESKMPLRWYKNIDYFRMDGGTQEHFRHKWINAFNDENDTRSRLFLISTRAGGLGVNLVGANRVVIFDASWNPSHDTQSMFRVYRFGQTKKCYIYRFIAEGTMEEKIYQRQVNKQSLAFRVVDEQQINRHFTASSLQEMYTFQPTMPDVDKPEQVPILPKDEVLADILSDPSTKRMIASYHEHDSLLDHQVGEELTEEERKAAWEEYEAVKAGRYVEHAPVMNMQSPQFVSPFPNIGTSGSFVFPTTLFEGSNPSVQLDKLSRMVSKAYFQYERCEVQPIETIIEHLGQTPLYRSAEPQTLLAIATEVNLRLKHQKAERYSLFQKYAMQFNRLRDTYLSLWNKSSNSKSPANGPVRILNKEQLLNHLASTSQSSNSSQSQTSITEVIDITDDDSTYC